MLHIGLGGGCHWCTEGVFSMLRGVSSVRQGWIAAQPPDGAFSEAVLLDVDEEHIGVCDLIEIHLETHASHASHALRGRYRSAIYAQNALDEQRFTAVLAELQGRRGMPLVTRVLRLVAFRESLPAYRHYFSEHPERPFCQRYILPKLRRVSRWHPDLLARERLPDGVFLHPAVE